MIAVFLHHLFARSFHHVYRYVLGKTYESGERVEGQEQAPVARNEPGLHTGQSMRISRRLCFTAFLDSIGGLKMTKQCSL